MTAPDPALTARAEAAWGEIAAERWPGDRPLTPAWFRTGFIAGALSEREATRLTANDDQRWYGEPDTYLGWKQPGYSPRHYGPDDVVVDGDWLAAQQEWSANAQITLDEDLSHIRKLEGMVAELRIRIFKAQALAHKPGAHKEHVLAALDPDA